MYIYIYIYLVSCIIGLLEHGCCISGRYMNVTETSPGYILPQKTKEMVVDFIITLILYFA